MSFYDDILKVIWFIFIQGALKICSYVNQIIDYISVGLLKDIINNNKSSFLKSFKIICYAAICIAALLFIINFIYQIAKDKETISKIIFTSLKRTLFGVFIIIFIPQILAVVMVLINFSVNLVYRLFASDSNSISTILYYIGNENTDWNNISTITNFKCPKNIGDYNFFIEIVCVVIVTWTLINVMFSLTGKTIELFTLYLIGPLISITCIVDNNKRLITWRKYLISNSLEVSMVVLSINIFTTLVNTVISTNINLDNVSRELFIFVFVVAAAMTTLYSQKIISILCGNYDYKTSSQLNSSVFNISRGFKNKVTNTGRHLKNIVGLGNGFKTETINSKGEKVKKYVPTGIVKHSSNVIKRTGKILNGLSNISVDIFSNNPIRRIDKFNSKLKAGKNNNSDTLIKDKLNKLNKEYEQLKNTNQVDSKHMQDKYNEIISTKKMLNKGNINYDNIE